MKTMFFYFFITILSVIESSVFAQHQISVCVIEEETGQPIQDAYVQVLVGGESQGVFLADNTVCSTTTSVQKPHGPVSSIPQISPPYPNPTGGIANVPISSGSSSPINYVLYDILGRQLEAGQIAQTGLNTNLRLNLIDQAPGVYFAHIFVDQYSQTVKLVKQKAAMLSLGAPIFQQKYPSLNSDASSVSYTSLSDSTQINVSVITTDSLGARMGSYFSSQTTHLIESDTTLTIAVAPVPENNCSGEILMIAQQMPELIGGLASIQELIEYPQEALAQGVEGRVFAQFVVDTEGRVVNGVVVRGIGAGTEEETLRVIQLAKFNPGMQMGELVCIRMSLPVTFRL